jgi:hypothetical protein
MVGPTAGPSATAVVTEAELLGISSEGMALSCTVPSNADQSSARIW